MQTAGVKANLPKAELVAALQKSAEEWISDDEDEKSAPLHEKNTPLDENSVDDKNISYDVQNPIIVNDQVGLYFRQIRFSLKVANLAGYPARDPVRPDTGYPSGNFDIYENTKKQSKLNAFSLYKTNAHTSE